MKLEFFKEQYEKQQELKESLGNRFTIIMTIVPLLFGAIFFCFKNINDLEKYPIFFWSLLVCASTSLVFDGILIFLLLKHFRGEVYEVMPRPSEWDRVYKEQETYVNNEPNPDVEDDFKKYLCKEYLRISDHNWGVNNTRIIRLNRVHSFIIYSLISTLLAVICYFPSFFYDNSNTQKVEITNTPKIQLQEVPYVKQARK